MSVARTAAIDLAEAAYDLECGAAEWFPRLLEVGGPLFQLGRDCGGGVWAGLHESGVPMITQACGAPGSPQAVPRYIQTAQQIGNEAIAKSVQAFCGRVRVLSEIRDEWPRHYEEFTKVFDAQDAIELYALDPNYRGVSIQVMSSRPVQLSAGERHFWYMILVHLTTAARLRRNLGLEPAVPGARLTDLPHQAEAVLDPKKFVVSEATDGARTKDASEAIRDAAIRVDRARGRLRGSDPHASLELWHGLVRGRWSLIDWFDTDGRRFVLAKPNAPRLDDPRGLTEREVQVATYAARGESSKLIGYRFGISPQRVSALLGGAMHKLGARTPAHLVEKMRGMPQDTETSPERD